MVRMQADTVSLCKFPQAWRHKIDDSRYCCDQQKMMRGKERLDLRAPGVGVPKENYSRQETKARKL
jgi:hypothetical protein